MKKRALSLFLVLVLCLGLMPVSVFAEEGDTTGDTTGSTTGETVTEPETPETPKEPEEPETPTEPTVTLTPSNGSTLKVYTGETFTTSVQVTNGVPDCTFSWALSTALYVTSTGSPQNTSNSSTQTWRAVSDSYGRTEGIFCYVNGKRVGEISVEVTKNPREYSVFFNSNGGSGSMSSAPNIIGDYTLPKCTFGTPAGKEFKCWATNANGTGLTYKPGETHDLSYSLLGNYITLYAIWQDIPGTVPVPPSGGSLSQYGSFPKTSNSDTYDRSQRGDFMFKPPEATINAPYKESDFEYRWTTSNQNVVGFESLSKPSKTTTTDINGNGVHLYLPGNGTAQISADLYYQGKYVDRVHTRTLTITGSAPSLTVSIEGGKTQFKAGETVTLTASGNQYGYDWQVLKFLSTGGTTNGGRVNTQTNDKSKVTWTAPTVTEETDFRFWCTPLNEQKWPMQEYTKMVDITVLPSSATIAYDANGGTGTMKSQTITSLGTYNLPKACSFTAPAGKQFKGWAATPDGKIITEYTFDKPDTTTTFYAIWGEPSNCTVSFDSNGGSSVSGVVVTTGKPYGTLPTPTRAGYTFDGWYTAKTGGSKVTDITTVTAASNHTLYAHWTQAKRVTVYFNSNGGSSVSSKTVTVGETYGTLSTPTRSGYTFNGWYTSRTGGSEVTSSTKVTETSNHTLYAHWTQGKPVTVTVYFSSNGGSSVSDKTVTVGERYGSLSTPTREGYTFDGWYTSRTGGSEVTSSTTVTQTSSHTLYAHWTQVKPGQITVSFDSNGGSSVSSRAVTPNETYGTLPTPTREGYTFEGWYTAAAGGSKVTSSTRVTETNNHTLYAYWTKLETTTGEQPSAWAKADVERAAELGILAQELQDKYRQPITRAEFCSLADLLWSKVTGSSAAAQPVSFTDTDDAHVLNMAAEGIVSGVGAGRFSPDGQLTREQAAAILVRLADTINDRGSKEHVVPAGTAAFADNGSISGWALEAVGRVQAGGVMSGVGENMFSPKGNYTREQAVITVMRIYDLLEN